MDEQYLDVDVQFGGTDQRKIFTFAEEYMGRIGYPKRVHLMNYMVPGLTGGKMSASEEDSKIGLLDGSKRVRTKINKAFCEERNLEGNCVLPFVKFVVFPMLDHLDQSCFIVERKYGDALAFETYQELEDRYTCEEDNIHPQDLKRSVASFLNHVLQSIREHFQSKEMQKMIKDAYK